MRNTAYFMAVAITFLFSTFKVAESAERTNILTPVTSVEIPTIASSTVRKKVGDGQVTKHVRLFGSSIGLELFFGKTEGMSPSTTLHVQKLTQESGDQSILAELNGKAEIQFAQLWELIEKQSSGQKGLLLVDGLANIAYIRDKDGDLLTVTAAWDKAEGCRCGPGWKIEAYYPEDKIVWKIDNQVISH